MNTAAQYPNGIPRRGVASRLGASFRLSAALASINIKAAFHQRAAFWSQALLMAVNNILFFAIWWLFLDQFTEIRGWGKSELALLYGVCAGSFGLHIVLCGGVRELARRISEGDLDVYLTQPKPVLVQICGSRTISSGWGDMATAAAMFLGCGLITDLPTAGLVALCLVCAFLVWVAASVAVHSIAFWAGPMDNLARQYTDFLIIFSMYPGSLYSGWLRTMLFTLVPSAFVGFLPVELILKPSWELVALMLGGTAGVCVAAWLIFRIGLRRYESGNLVRVNA